MKTITCKSLLLMLLVTFSMTVSAQTAYKGQLYVSDESFHHDGDMLRVHMKVSYDDTAVPSGESLIFTPVLKNDTIQCRLSSVVIDGDRLAKTMHRAETLRRFRRSNVAVVVKDKKAERRYFVYDTTVPYDFWMKGSSLYVQSEENTSYNVTPNHYEDRVLVTIPFDNEPISVGDIRVTSAQLLTWVQYIDPSGTDCDVMTHKGVISLFGINSRLSTNKQNKLIFDTLYKDINTTIQLYGTSLNSAKITGYGSPIGNHNINELKSMKRALSLKRYLMNNKLTASNMLDVSWIAEDWDSIQTLTAESSMNLKEAACDIMHNVPVTGGRETVLQDLYDGIPYQYMRTVIFPKVHRVAYTLVYNRKGVDAATGRLLMKQSPRSMTLTDFWNVSQSYDKGSREFNDVIDLSARIFHDNPIANINAAAVALTRKDVRSAQHYLQGLDTDPRAYNNYGLLYLLEGNTDKAEVYLRMARAAGVMQSDDVLKFIKK